MHPDMNPAVRDSAPYGKACQGCSRAKCRCIPRGPGLSCERCDRLQKDCLPSLVVRKRPARRPPRRAPTAAQLEQKLDGLAALVRAQTEAGHRISEDAEHGLLETASRISAGGTSSQYRRQRNGTVSESPGSSSTNYLTPTSITSPLAQEPSPSQAEQYLHDFRKNHIRMFPFVYIPPGTTAAQLKRERPFLWLNIRASSCKSLQEQVILEKRIREVAAQKLLIDLEQSMDLLLGLIAFLNWSGEKYRGKPILGPFSGLMSALLGDLRLDRHREELSCREVNVCRANGFPIKHGPSTVRTNEERRAALACFILTTSFSSFLKKPSAIKWTAYMDDCVRHLSREQEAPDDEVLVAIARTFKIMENVSAVMPLRLPDSEKWQLSSTPPMLLIKSLRTNLEDIRRTTSQETLKNKVVMAYLLSTEAMINELPLYPVDRPAVAPGCVDFGKTECFYACLSALTQFHDNWFTFTPQEILGVPMPLHMLAHRATHILYRLALLDDPAWDRAAVTHVIDPLAALERCADLCSAVPAAIGLETDGSDIYNRIAAVQRETIPIWRKALEEAGVSSGHLGNAGGAIGVEDLPTTDLAFDGWFNESFPPFNPF